jgi:hypothetical protein
MNNNQMNDNLYISLGDARTLETIPLVFTIPENLPPVKVNGFILSWTNEALANFSQVHEDLKKIKNLPYASLRGFLEIKLPNVSRIESSMGLTKLAIKSRNYEIEPFAYIDGDNAQQITKDLKSILNDWLENYLVPYGQRENVSEKAIERLRELQEENKLLSIKLFQSQIFPWLQHDKSGTAKPYKYSFPALVDYLARLIAEHEIFQELGGIKRIITNNAESCIKLITNPISLGSKGLFSLLIDIEIITFPSLSQPLIKIDVHKRRWLSSLKDNGFNPNDINGYVFSKNHSDRVFNFKLNRRNNLNTNQWEWQPDSAFNVLQRELNLPLHISNAKQIVKGEASTDDCQVLLTYRDGIQQKKHDIKAGVPEKDKLEAFRAIAEILKLQGIKPFDGYTKVKFPKGTSHSNNIIASRTINTPTFFSPILEFLQNKYFSDGEKKSIDEMSDQEINNILKESCDFQLSKNGIQNLQFNSKNINQTEELQQLCRANQEAIKRLYPNEKPLLIIFHENECYKTVTLLEAVINILCEDKLELQLQRLPENTPRLEIKLQRLPENTHGAKIILPGNNLKNKDRSQLRVKAWRSTAEQIAKIDRPKFCLVMAREFYPNPQDNNKQLHDDLVNKPSTRKALASIGRSCVQFILPPEIWRTSGDLHVSDFIIRAQASIKDLIWAHSGRIDNVKEKVNQWFGDIELENRPKEIIAITIDRKNAGRARGRLENTFLPIAIRTNVETGLSEMCCCYEDSKTENLVITSWQPFTEALFDIANISPISLGKKEDTRKKRFQEFVEQIISNSVKENKKPVVTLDSSNCVKLWNWLNDSKMNLSNIDINSKNYMQDNWKGARIVRVRQDLAPGIIEDKVKYLTETFLDDTRTKEKLKADKDKQITISAPSSPTGLYKLNVENKTGCVPYLSIGKKTLHQLQRGASCYREVEQDKFLPTEEIDDKGNSKRVKNKAGLEIKTLEKQEPYTDQWATPNPLEIVVTLRQEQDKPDNIAGFVESLRYGYGHFNEWTILPAPLFFERVVRDYISAFTLEEDEAAEGVE